jgi:hypothetical protein
VRFAQDRRRQAMRDELIEEVGGIAAARDCIWADE